MRPPMCVCTHTHAHAHTHAHTHIHTHTHTHLLTAPRHPAPCPSPQALKANVRRVRMHVPATQRKEKRLQAVVEALKKQGVHVDVQVMNGHVSQL